MAPTQAMCTSFKKELLLGVHRFGTNSADTFKLALYTSSTSIGAGTTAFTTSNEVSASGSYSSGGGSLTGVAPASSGTKAFTDFANVQFTSATITARGALIYNSTPSANDESGSSLTNPAVCVLNFESDKTSTAGTFTVAFPTPDADNAIIRIA